MEAEFQIFGVLAKMKCGSVDLSIFGSPGRTSVEDERYLWSPGRAEVRKAELQIFGSQGSAELRKHNFTSLKVPAEMKCGSGHTHTWKSWQNKCERRTGSFEVMTERKYGKWNFRSLAVKAEQKCGSGTSHLWKSRQR